MRAIREAAGLSISSLALETAFSQSHLRSAENGNRAVTRELAEACDKALRTGGFLAGMLAAASQGSTWGEDNELDEDKELDKDKLRDADRVLRGPWTVAGTLAAACEVSEVNPVERRSFMLLTGAVLAAPAHEWLIAHPVGDVSGSAGRAIEPDLVDHLDDITDQFRRMDDRIGGGSLIDVVRAQARYVAGLMRECRYTDSTGRRLHSTLGELLRLTGWVSFDNGDDAQAQRYWIAALHSAHAAGDSALGANILGFMSDQAVYLGRPGDAVKIAETALAGYKGSSPRVSAMLHMRAALPYAAKGDETECRRSIDAAYDAFRNPMRGSEEPAWCYWMDEESFNEMIGTCLISLNDYISASRHLELSLRPGERQADSRIRDGVQRLRFLASAYARQDEPERACEVGMRAIDAISGQVDSVRLAFQIRGLGDDLEPYRSVPAVQEFSDRVNALVGAQRA